MEVEVREAWEQGEVVGWENRGLPIADAQTALDLEAFQTEEELEAVGADKLKEALQQLGLKCGGTPRQRAERLMLAKDTPLEALDARHFAKGFAPTERAKRQEVALRIALLEGRVRALADVVGEVVEDTKNRVQKKFAQSVEELQNEADEEMDIVAARESDDEEQEVFYNPLRLPLGFDGKPIPYWLYKLHGLNQEFKCEICGDYSYWGRRAFEKHFKEWRHQNGMRALGIPNTKAFFEVTSIAEAKALHAAIERRHINFQPEVEEEMEDSNGNVYRRHVYDDLRRQGIKM